ncbi:hypothetical protein BGZ76_004573, partial [Entomortierella beljakovae]
KRKDGKVTGSILLNGKVVHESEIRRSVGYVDQEDTLPATQTVYEAILFSAMLRLPEAMPIYRVHERVNEVIEMLGLTHCADRRIGNVTSRGISGGEKRRVSIALELITRPPILILDEPTSGLDSFSAHMVVDQLCKLAASKTTTVILTIHQPRSDIFFMFDHTLVVSKGEALYFGRADSAAEYFSRRGLVCPTNYNIADYLLDVAMDQDLVAQAKNYQGSDDEKSGFTSGHQSRSSGNNLLRRGVGNGNSSDITRISGSSNEANLETTVRMEDSGSIVNSAVSLSDSEASKHQGTVYPTSFLTQLRVIMKRNFQTLIRDKSLLVLHVIVAIILGAFIGGLYFDVPMDLAGFQNRAGSLFFMLALLGFSSISALGAFTDTRTLFIKERSNGYYPPTPFVIATLLFDLIPLRIVPSIILGCISYFMIGLTADVVTFFKFLLILVLFNISTAMFCLVIAAGVRATGVASLASSIVMLFMMLFGGFMINSGKIPAALTWIQYLSMFKFGFEALAVNEVATTHLIDNIQGVAFNVPGSLILQKMFGFDLGGYWKNMIILIGFNILFIALFWIIITMRLKERNNKLMRFQFSLVVAMAVSAVVTAQNTTKTTVTATSTVTVTSTATASPQPVCQPLYDCSTSPMGCLNSGVCQGSTCKCMPGFGGNDCSLLACGSPLIEASQRPTADKGDSCKTCDDGFAGFNCNVCQSDAGCQSRAASRTSLLGSENMVCNKKSEVFYNSYMNCAVRAPELTGFFPGDYTLTLDLDVNNKTAYAQLWLGKTEQFYCSIPDCTIATTNKDGAIQTKWDCPVLNCKCLTPTLMCGGIPGPPIQLGDVINNLKGPFSLTCPEGKNNCQFYIDDMSAIFPSGLQMEDCDRGECVFPSEMNSSVTNVESKMATGVIVCLAIIGALIIFLIVVCSIARRRQLILSRTPYTLNTEAASLEFRNVGYTLNQDGLEILKGISGAAPAGVVLAVMGPSGAGKSTLVDILGGKRKDGK